MTSLSALRHKGLSGRSKILGDVGCFSFGLLSLEKSFINVEKSNPDLHGE